MHDSNPYLGAIVHYREFEGQDCQAAIITRVPREGGSDIDLCVWRPGGTCYPASPKRNGGENSWHSREECDG